jgi:hypothetical protein
MAFGAIGFGEQIEEHHHPWFRIFYLASFHLVVSVQNLLNLVQVLGK